MTADNQTPEAFYTARRERFAREADGLHTRWNRVANLRLAAFLAAVACLGWGIRAGMVPLLVAGAALLVAFLALVRHHVLLGQARRRALELVTISEEAGARRRRDWAALPLRSAYRAAPDHPYAADLDLFGHASLFHLLHPGGTALGESTLRDWLLSAAPPAIVASRQQAVAELAGRIDLRDDLIASGRLAEGRAPDPAPFLRWAEGKPWLLRRSALLWAARILPPLFWLALGLWLTGIVTFPLYLLCLLAIEIVWRILGRRTLELLATISAQQAALQHFAASFAVLDGVAFDAPELARLQADLSAEGMPAYRQMRRLTRLAQFVIPPDSLSHGILQRLALWDVHTLAALERWQRDAGGRARRWLAALGEIEALAALGGLAHAEPDWTMPALDPAAPAIAATALGHPLLAAGVRVANDVAVGPSERFLLVTGSNMSGKSTLLRAIGTNLVLAGAGGSVCAATFRQPPVALWTSMRIQDSLAQGVSYYLAELQRLKAIVDAARTTDPAAGVRLCYLIDEMLQGTNTAERQIAARRIIAHLVRSGALGAVSTHDLNLADAPPLSESALLVHFTEQFTTGPDGPAMTFDYHLRPGIATSTNALKLMELIGLTLEDPRVQSKRMRIETDRLILREFRDDDWAAVLAYQSDPRYLHFYDWESRSPDEVQAFVAMFIRLQEETPRTKFQLAIETKADGRLIGNCGVRQAAPGARVADMGYELAPDEWGKGYATEAATAIRDFGFATLGIHRLWASCVPENTASARVLEKLGLRREGRLRENDYYKGRWWDELIYGILEDQWRALPQGRGPHPRTRRAS